MGAFYQQGQYLAAATYLAVLSLGLFQSLGMKAQNRLLSVGTISQVAAVMLIAVGVYFAIEQGLNAVLADVVPSAFDSPYEYPTLLALAVGTFLVFWAGFYLVRD